MSEVEVPEPPPRVVLPLWMGVGAVLASDVLALVTLGGVLALLDQLGSRGGPANAMIAGAAMLIGLSQLLWVVPMVVLAFVQEQRSFAIGAIIAAGIVAMLNASCFGLVALSF